LPRLGSWVRIPSPAPNLHYKEVNKLRAAVRDLARILRVPNWAFVTANVTVRFKWRPFVKVVNKGRHNSGWQNTHQNLRLYLPKQQPCLLPVPFLTSCNFASVWRMFFIKFPNTFKTHEFAHFVKGKKLNFSFNARPLRFERPI
jgi:hypothetical protein